MASFAKRVPTMIEVRDAKCPYCGRPAQQFVDSKALGALWGRWHACPKCQRAWPVDENGQKIVIKPVKDRIIS